MKTPPEVLQQWIVGNTRAVAVTLAYDSALALQAMTYINQDAAVQLGPEERIRMVAAISVAVQEQMGPTAEQ
jgi:hypothetical protein